MKVRTSQNQSTCLC